MTVLTARVTDRILFWLLYIAAGAIVIWFGFRLVDHSTGIRFTNDYLRLWEVAISAFEAQNAQWPEFKGNNHVAYMEELVLRMRRSGVQPPESNTPVAYRYGIDRLIGANEEIFILCLSDRIILYGISEMTLHYLDKALDGTPSLTDGRLIGRSGKNQRTHIGQWWL